MLLGVTIKIKCIKCGGHHRYGLRIKRQLVLGASSNDSARKGMHTVYVICPKVNEVFAIEITVEDQEGRPIVSIEALLDEQGE
jgi:hypothetical protein